MTRKPLTRREWEDKIRDADQRSIFPQIGYDPGRREQYMTVDGVEFYLPDGEPYGGAA